MKKIFLTLIATVALSLAASAQIEQINSNKLPGNARATIRSAWNGAPIVDAWRNKEGKRVEYKASVENGSTMKFNANGQWIEVKGYGGVPENLFPSLLIKHIHEYYEGQYIVFASRTTKRFQIELSDGTRLQFNAKGAFEAFLK